MKIKSESEIWASVACSVLFTFVGLFLVGYFSHWAVAGGVFLIKWSGNIDRSLIDYRDELRRKLKK